MPGFFGDQADRLLRKKWDDPYELAQELWAMFNADVPMTTDQPIIQTRNNNEIPATKIIDNTDGSSSPITITKTGPPSSQPNIGGGGYSCCGGSGSPGGSPSKDPSKQPPTKPPAGGGDVGPAPPPPPGDPNLPYRQFSATVEIEIHQGEPDIFGWDGLRPKFTATGCFPYKPPTVGAPDTGFNEDFNDPSTINSQIAEFMAHNGLDGYSVISDSVSAAGLPCDS